jgi:hypothetical protein
LGYFEEEEFAIFGEATQPRKRAEMLDEALQVLDGLWSGEPFHFDGKHYHLNEIQYHPAALQQPRIPVWVAGMWPNKAPARRAARWDGFFPIPKEDRPLSPDEVHDMLAIIKENRLDGSSAPFDLVVSGYSEGGKAQWDQELVQPLSDAGATWFLEACDPWRFDYDQTLARIQKGPPEVQ